jgi:hypothetical protein
MFAALAVKHGGTAETARASLRDLQTVFHRLPTSATSDDLSIWGFSERSLKFSEAQVHSFLGDRREAAQAVDQALTLYPPELVHGLANLRLIQAYGLIGDRDVSCGLDHAVAAVQGPPVTPARRRIVNQLIDALPEQARGLPATQELRALTAT